MTACIRGVASALPHHSVSLAYASATAAAMSCETEAQATKLGKLYRRTGVETRGSVLLETTDAGELTQSFYPPLRRGDQCVAGSDVPETGSSLHGPTMQTRNERFAVEAPKIGVRAAKEALNRAGVCAPEITHVVTITCTGFSAPGLDVQLIKQLELPLTTQRLALGFMGCHGLINGIRAAKGLVAADSQSNVLICSVELCSLHYQYGYDAQRIVSGSIFADGAAAVVIGASDPASDGPTPQVLATGSCLMPDSEHAMTWKIGDHGFQMTLDASVPGLVETHLADFLVPWLAQHGHTIESIGGWAVHPGGTRILTAVQHALDLDETVLDISRDVLRRHGNMSSATLGIVLEDFAAQSVALPWLMLGFGPGLEIEVALIG